MKAAMSVNNVFFQESDGDLFVSPDKVYPAAVKGRFRRLKWVLLFLTLGIYYALPFLRWHREGGAPDQAVLLDFAHQRLYFFFVEIWPQDFFYITGILIIAAFALFLANAISGRVWCGYLCPQTVWTDLFRVVERVFQGERREQMKRDAGAASIDLIWRKAATWAVWLVIGVGTGGAWVLYFVDAPTLVREIVSGDAPALAYIWIAILTTTTFFLGGFYREQVCMWMCPWPRIQAALTDEWALNISYRVDRGEPRGSLKENERLRADGGIAGDCIDCRQCVAVCPTGVDIRQGLQMGCIQCGLCIDACDSVMTKIGQPTGLIAYDTDINIQRREQGLMPVFKLIRARTVIYVALILLTATVMITVYANRATIGLNVLHDRNPLHVVMSDGSIRNAYTIRILNKSDRPRRLDLALAEGPKATLSANGESLRDGAALSFDVGADQTFEARVFLTAPQADVSARSTPVVFRLTAEDPAGAEISETRDFFDAP